MQSPATCTATGAPVPVVPVVIFVYSVSADYHWYTAGRGEAILPGRRDARSTSRTRALDVGQAAWQHNLAICFLALKQLQHGFTEDIRDLEYLLQVRMRPRLLAACGQELQAVTSSWNLAF